MVRDENDPLELYILSFAAVLSLGWIVGDLVVINGKLNQLDSIFRPPIGSRTTTNQRSVRCLVLTKPNIVFPKSRVSVLRGILQLHCTGFH